MPRIEFVLDRLRPLGWLAFACWTVAAPTGIDAQSVSEMAAGEVVLTILHTNDLHGSVHYPGEAQGLAKIATRVRQIRAEMPNVLLMDGGDIIHGTPAEKIYEGMPIIAAMNAAGYDVAVAGNHEFDFGQRIGQGAIAAASFPMLSANVVDAASGESYGGLLPYMIREIEGVRVAIFGLTTDRTPEIQWPRTIAGIEFRDAIDAARSLVPRLRDEENADLVVALTHIGVEADRELALAVPNIDVIVGGHSHTRLDEQVWVGETLIVQTGSAARALGRVDLVVQREENEGPSVAINGRDGRWWGHGGIAAPLGLEYPGQPLIPLSVDILDDPAVVAAYQPYNERVQTYLDEELTTALEPLAAEGAGVGEIPLGNLQADAVRDLTGADIGLSALYSLNSAGLAAGPVSVRDVYELFGGYTRQHLVVIRARGATVRAALESANADAVRLHVSGVRARADDYYVGEIPLHPDSSYTVASAAHILQDYLIGRAGVTVVSDDPEAPTIRDATIEYLRDHPPLANIVEHRVTHEP
ncbi:MAG: hypothetical protein GEU90_09465 [Gemmatimonas sp.]|nr:hypothetical protein [Gemmatimonas sp.]